MVFCQTADMGRGGLRTRPFSRSIITVRFRLGKFIPVTRRSSVLRLFLGELPGQFLLRWEIWDITTRNSEKELKENHILKKYGRIRWQEDFETDCTFTWYEGKNELRISGFGRGKFPLSTDYTGALFVLVKDSEEEYKGYLLNTDDDIEQFLGTFGLTPVETNRPIKLNRVNPYIRRKDAIGYIHRLYDV